MEHKIQRINHYKDERFKEEVLKQHGAFIVDDIYRCSFKIINENSAMVEFDREVQVIQLIDEFRFYSQHIINFYDKDMMLIKAFPSMDIFYIDIKDIQPSQFYVDEEKVKAIESFIKSEEDIIIPLTKIGDTYISEDGHTRLYYAVSKGFTKVRGFITSPGDYTGEFAKEARKRKVYSPYDLKLISHEEYKIKWHKFCDDFFEGRNQ